jgi:galactokinase
VPLHDVVSSGVDGGAGLSEAAAVRVDPEVLFETYNMSAVRWHGGWE